MPKFCQHTRNIPANDNRQSREHRQNIRHQLSLANSEKDKDEAPPNVEQQQLAHIVDTAVADGRFYGLNEQARPREHPQNYYGKIVPEGHAVGVLRRSKARQIVKAQKGFNKFHAMHRIHSVIPRCSQQKIQQQPANYVHTQNFPQLSHNYQIDKDDSAGKNNADGAFGNGSQRHADIHQPIFFMRKAQNCSRHKKEQRRIRYRRLAHVKKLHAACQNHR